MALGGLDHTATSATVTVGEVTVSDGTLSQDVQGSLSGPMAVYRIPVDAAAAGSDGYRRLLLTAIASDGDVSIEVADDPGDDSILVEGYGTVVEESTVTATQSVETSSALVVVTGDPGAGFSFRLDPDPRGFTGGQRVGRVTVPAQSTVAVPFDLGTTETDVELIAEWSTSADIDGVLFIGTVREDSDLLTRYGGDLVLSGVGTGAGSVELRNLSTVPVDVDLELALDP